MAQSAEHGGAAQPALQLTFEEAQVAVRESKAPPARGKANDKLQNRCGAYVDFEAEPRFHWQAYLVKHPASRAIFRAHVIGFLCEVFPEKKPNASNM